MQDNPFYSLKVLPNYSTGTVISWELDPTFKDDAPFTFTLQATETPDFSQLIFEKSVGDSFFAIDDTNLRQAFIPSYIYRVKLVTGSGKTFYSESLNYFAMEREEKHKYLMAREIVRREFVRLRYVGYDGFILKRKNYGEIAKGSVSKISGIVLTEGGSSKGTSFSGGFHKPLRIIYSYEGGTSVMALNPSGMGVDDETLVKVRMLGFPLVMEQDVIIDREDDRYVITKVDPTTFPGTGIIVVQEIEAKLLSPTDPIYDIEVPRE